VALATAVLAPAPVMASSGHAGTGQITLVRSHDPETQAAGIHIVYRWDVRFGRKYTASVRLFQDGILLGRIPFMPGWSKAPAFFRTSSAPSLHTFRAVGVLLHKDGTAVAGSRERSDRKHWRRTVQPGQIVR
jgi:hypothetical protein